MSVERAVLAAGPRELEAAGEGFDRAYLGCEFCERLLPTPEGLREALGIASRRGMPLTLVTPYATEDGLARVEALLGELPAGSEVVANDWGVLALARERGLEPVLGRLLTKQRRDPRLADVWGLLPDDARLHLGLSAASAGSGRRLLRSLRVRRVELDCLLHGVGDDLSGSELRGTLYHPYAYLTTTRLCPAAGFLGGRSVRAIRPCRRECEELPVELSSAGMPVPVLARGNAWFVRVERMPERLEERGFDRVVEELELPR